METAILETTITVPSNLGRLAHMIEQDIRRKGLASGQPYMTSHDVGRLLGVHRRMASRAMQLLADREILVCKRGVGTFVGPKADVQQTVPMKSVHVLLSREFLCDVSLQDVFEGIIEQVPGCDVVLNLLQPRDELGHVRQVFDKSLGDGTMSGVVMLGCSRPVHELVLQYNVPAVVCGSDYSSTRNLASVDIDQMEIGRLMAHYLVERGHRRMTLLMHETWQPGDNRLFEGVQEVLDKAGLRSTALVLRNLPPEKSLVEAELTHLFATEDRPTGCICRSRFFAQAALQVAQTLGLHVPDELDVVYDASTDTQTSKLHLPRVQSTLGFKTQCANVGQMLNLLITQEHLESKHVVIPACLVDQANDTNGDCAENQSAS